MLPSALYRVRLDEGPQPIVAHIADRMDRNFIRL
ncbi:MAG: translation initiation factor IF-1, partial [Acidobacteria bacterium]